MLKAQKPTKQGKGSELQNDQEGFHGEEIRIDEDVESLRHGCPERGIWFAGEHTAPFVALGTVTGAYWSGEAVGRRILAAYGLGDGDVLMNEHEGQKRAVNGGISMDVHEVHKAAANGIVVGVDEGKAEKKSMGKAANGEIKGANGCSELNLHT